MDAGKVLEISALGRPLHLGTLYNARNDSIVPGMRLWDKEEMEENITDDHQFNTNFKADITDSFSARSKLLDLNGSLKASVLLGLVDVSGSANYLNSEITSNRQCSVTMQYRVTTGFKKLTVTNLKVQHPEVFKEPEPTHVVIKVLYGAVAFMEFKNMAKNESEKHNVQGDLEAMVKRIPSVEICGNGKAKLSSEDEKKMQNIFCTFHGDFILNENPSTYEEAVKVFKQLPSLLGENKENVVPLRVWLYPLRKLNDMASIMSNEISDSVLSNIEKVIHDLRQARVRASDLIQMCNINAVDIIRKLECFQTHLNSYTADFLQRMKDLLPAIREGTAEETAMREHLASLNASGFSKKDMDDWLSVKSTEIEKVTYYIKKAGCEIKPANTDFESLSTEKDVAVFCFTSLNDAEPYLTQISLLPKVSLPNQHVLKTPWYKGGAAESAWKVFSNKNDCEKVISFITDEDHPGASVRVYHHSKLKFKNRKPQKISFNYKLQTLDASNNQSMKSDLEDIKLGHRSAKHLRFLVYGPVGHGKSSFINSVNSVFQGRICIGALAAATAGKSFTHMYKTHHCYKKDKKMPFVFCDIMGLEEDEGILTTDVISCLEGHVQEKYKFNALTPIRENDVKYNSNPSVDDKVHCLVTVVSAEKINLLSDEDNIIKKMKEIIDYATDMEIPVAVVMTHVDMACPSVKEDLCNICSSARVTKKVKVCCDLLNVSEDCILTVKNYHDETKVDPNVDCLILRAFKELVLCANKFVEYL